LEADLKIHLGERSYRIMVSPDAWDQLPGFLDKENISGKLLVVTDDRVGSLYSSSLAGVLEGTGRRARFHTIPQGEESKSFFEIERLCRSMSENGFDRKSVILAMGGGVVGDLAGLAASVYLRGVTYIQLPTTLLAMVDSSVGGKTGINIPEGKNLVGTFYQPAMVCVNTRTLETLEARDWYSGMAEVVKIALTSDPVLFGYLEGFNEIGPDAGIEPTRIIKAACMKKALVVEEDERESGQRRVLNFGHTLGHALEASAGFGGLRHGEAVALGMKASLELSRRQAGLPEDQFKRAMEVIDRIPTPQFDSLDGLSEFILRDKKSSGGAVTIVLIEGIGIPRLVPLNDPGALLDAFTAVA